jgi:hypothetical protein
MGERGRFNADRGHRGAEFQKLIALIPVDLWLHGRSLSTQGAYAGDVRAFLAHVGKPPLRAVTHGR